MTVSVCLSVCLRENTFDLHQNFRACYLWPWLGRILARCDMLCTSGFMGDVMFAHTDQEWATQ